MRRIFLAGFLIMAVWVVWGAFFAPTEDNSKNVVSESSTNTSISSDEDIASAKISSDGKDFVGSGDPESLKIEEEGELVNFTIKTPLFTADLSNRLGGTFLQYTLNDNKYKGAYTEESSKYDNKDKRHSYDKGAPVSLMFSEDEGFVACNPCLGGVETFGLHEVWVDGAPFSDALKDITKETVTNSDLADIWIRGSNDWNNLKSDVERYRFRNHYRQYFNMVMDQIRLRNEGVLPVSDEVIKTQARNMVHAKGLAHCYKNYHKKKNKFKKIDLRFS